MTAPALGAYQLGAEFAGKERVLRESDFISLHVPLLESTRHLIGEAELAKMKPGSDIAKARKAA